MTERVWNVLATLLIVAAVGFLWWNNLSIAFVLATLGVVAWFLSYRSQLRAKIADNEPDKPTIEETDED